jgi:ABC-type sugar transport system permease subunit
VSCPYNQQPSHPEGKTIVLKATQTLPRAILLALAAALTVVLVNSLAGVLAANTSTVEVGERVRAIVSAGGTILFIFFSSVALGMFARTVAAWIKLSPAEQQRVFWGFTFAGPWVVGFFIFVAGPALASLYYSFTDYKLGEPATWVGLENYRVLLSGEGAHGRRFGQAMYNSFYYAVVGVPLQIITSLVMAMLLNTALKGMRVFRLIFYLPVILAGGPAILLAWRYMLAANGGFINETLQNAANNFFLFDWLYRFFIYSVEGFNGFYAGIARGDPLGPLVYTIPALIGAVVLFTLVRGQWSEEKRTRAWRVAEVIGVVVIIILAARIIIGQPLDPALQSGEGIGILARQFTLTSSIAQPDNLDYLSETFPQAMISPIWIWAGVALILGAATYFNNRFPRAQRILLTVALIACTLLTIGSFFDTLRYFQAFETIAATNGTPNYHFSLFHQATAEWPDKDRVPLWLSSELWSKPSLILITMWSSGAGMLIFLAALKGVPDVLYEAARVDGANRRQAFFKITLPLISPALFYNIVVGVIAALQTFESVYIISNTQTQDSLSSAVFFLYTRTFRQLAIGQGSAVSWILAIIIVLLTVFQFRYSKWVHYEA